MALGAILAIFLVLPAGMLAGDVDSEEVDQIFARYNRPDSPGCSVGVIRNDNFVYRKAYGMGSLELNVPLSPESVFYMASVSKQFTAASIVLAAEKGFLSLDDDVRKYIPELPKYGHTITLRQMLHHTSGLPDVQTMLGGVAGLDIENFSPAELMDFIARQKDLNFDPGDQYQYNNTNYFLLAQVLQRATKKSLAEFASQNIFSPLRMTHTRFYDDRTLVLPGRVAAYHPGPDGKFRVDWSTRWDIVGAGGLMSSVDDLLLWDRNFYHNRLGKGNLVEEMQTPGLLNNGNHSNYGLGLTLSTYRGLPIVDHDGANFGYRSEILRFPKQRFSVVTLCNVATADAAKLSREVADIYLKNDFQRTKTVHSDPALFVGEYFDEHRHFAVTFTVERGGLVLQGHILEPIKQNQFEDLIVGGTVSFSGSNGSMSATVVYNNAVTFAGTRIGGLHLDDASLAAYAGTYKSSELDATYKISIENGSLVLHMNWNSPIKLQPLVQNEFDASGNTLVFRRDKTGHVSGLSVFSGWDALIRNERFERIN